MNKYQESLDFIVKNSCPSHMSCKECHMNKICNNLVKPHIDRIQELIDEHKQLEKSDASKEKCTIEQHQEIHELRDKVRQLEKALDKSCEQLEKSIGFGKIDAEGEVHTNCKHRTKEKWKEWLLEKELEEL